MGKKYRQLLTGLLLVLLCCGGGCAKPGADFTLRVIPPPKPDFPLKGTWQIVSALDENPPAESGAFSGWVGQKLYFDHEKLLLGSYLLAGIRYQIKRVRAGDYLHYQRPAFPQDFVFEPEEIEVITLSDEHFFWCELVRQSEDQLLLVLFNRAYRVSKISGSVERARFEDFEQAGDIVPGGASEQGGSYTGVLLGLRAPDQDAAGRPNETYRTLWLSVTDCRLGPVLETGGIIFPRRKGFYRLEVVREREGLREEDFLRAVALSDECPPPAGSSPDEGGAEPLWDFSAWGEKEGYLHRRVLYVGNDYVSLEETVKQNRGGGKINGNTPPLGTHGTFGKGEDDPGESRLRLAAVDALPLLKGVKISDLAGPGAARAMEQGRENLLSRLQLPATGPLEEDNFGLVRKTGYWVFNGRLNYEENERPLYLDYNIDVAPPEQVVFYNKLGLSWPRTKNYLPGTQDLLTAPNKDLALVATSGELLLYPLFQDNIAGAPLRRIPLKENETVIMAEWASGQYYVDNWTQVFQRWGKEIE